MTVGIDPPDLRRCRTATIVTVAIPIEVDDAGDPRLDDYRDLTTADRRPDRPGGRGLVIAEGVVVVRRLIDSPYPVRSLLGVPRRLAELTADLADLDVPAYAVAADTMAAVVGFHLNRGVLAVADRAAPPDPRALAAGRAAAGRRGGHQRPREPGRAVPQRRRARGRWGVARTALRRPALPAQRAGVDGARAAGAVRRPAGEWPGSLDVCARPGCGWRR